MATGPPASAPAPAETAADFDFVAPLEREDGTVDALSATRARLSQQHSHAVARMLAETSRAVPRLLALYDAHTGDTAAAAHAAACLGHTMRAGATPSQLRALLSRVAAALRSAALSAHAAPLLLALADAARGGSGPVAYFDFRGGAAALSLAPPAKWPFPKEAHVCAWCRVDAPPPPDKVRGAQYTAPSQRSLTPLPPKHSPPHCGAGATPKATACT
jgi:hypothetical protein